MYLGADRQAHRLWRCAVVAGWPPTRSRRNISAACSSRSAETGDPAPALREVFQARASARPTTPALHAIARHFSQPIRWTMSSPAWSRPRATDEFAAETLAAIAHAARRPACTSPSAQISAGLTLDMDECMRMEFRILNRMLDGPRFLRGHPRRDHRQGLDAALAAGDAGRRRSRRRSKPISRRWPTENCSCERRRRTAAVAFGPTVVEIDLRLVPARHRRLLPAVRRALLDPADRLLRRAAVALRPDAACTGRSRRSRWRCSFPSPRSACGCWPPGGRSSGSSARSTETLMYRRLSRPLGNRLLIVVSHVCRGAASTPSSAWS